MLTPTVLREPVSEEGFKTFAVSTIEESGGGVDVGVGSFSL